MAGTLSRRTQILLDERRHRRLEELSASTGESVGALIREAIDVAYPDFATDRARAVAELLSAEPIDFGGADWDEIRRDMLDSQYEGLVATEADA